MNRVSTKINLDPLTTAVLDAIADAIADELVPRPSRSDLLNKAALLYVERARRREKLRRAIEGVEAAFRAEHPPGIKPISDAKQRGRLASGS